MAEINKPEYQTKRKPGSRRAIYNVQPARSNYLEADPTAGDVTLSTANIFSKIQDSLGIFAEIYAQSEKTANVLQAKGLLINKMENTQKMKNLISTDLKYTPYENLKLKDVLDNYLSLDSEGKTNLYIGKELSTHINPLQMPDDLSDEVKGMVDQQWVKMNIDIMNHLITQNEIVQGAQIEGMLDFTIENFIQQYINDTRTNSDKKKRRELLTIHLNNLFPEIDRLAELGTYAPNQVRKQKDKVIQKALTAEFQSDMLFEGNRNTAIDNADKGEYNYKMDDGREISLSRATIYPYMAQRISEMFKSHNDYNDYLSKVDRTAFAQSLGKDAISGPGAFLLKYGVFKDGKFKITNEKIDKDPDLHQYMMSELKDKGPDADGNLRTATKEEERKIKTTLLLPIYIKAIEDHEAELKRQDGEKFVDANFNTRYIESIISEWQVHLTERVAAKRGGKWDQETAEPKEARRIPLGNKKLNQEQLAEVVQLENYAEEITVIAESVNNWTLAELNNKIKYLESKKFKDDNFSGLSVVAQNILRGRVRDLSENIAEIQLKESSLHNNSVFVGGNGQYKMEDVGDWQKAHGITNTYKIVPKAILAEIAIFEDENTPLENKLALLEKLVTVKFKFSGNYKQMAHNQISRNMTKSGMEGLFGGWENQVTRDRKMAIGWLKGQLLKLAE